jgi:hypothetical protein
MRRLLTAFSVEISYHKPTNRLTYRAKISGRLLLQAEKMIMNSVRNPRPANGPATSDDANGHIMDTMQPPLAGGTNARVNALPCTYAELRKLRQRTVAMLAFRRRPRGRDLRLGGSTLDSPFVSHALTVGIRWPFKAALTEPRYLQRIFSATHVATSFFETSGLNPRSDRG